MRNIISLNGTAFRGAAAADRATRSNRLIVVLYSHLGQGDPIFNLGHGLAQPWRLTFEGTSDELLHGDVFERYLCGVAEPVAL